MPGNGCICHVRLDSRFHSRTCTCSSTYGCTPGTKLAELQPSCYVEFLNGSTQGRTCNVELYADIWYVFADLRNDNVVQIREVAMETKVPVSKLEDGKKIRRKQTEQNQQSSLCQQSREKTELPAEEVDKAAKLFRQHVRVS